MGFAAAQAVHAASESIAGPVPSNTNVVVVAVPGEATLLAVAAQLAAAGLEHTVVHEPDAPWCGQATAIGLPPGDRDRARPVLRHLPLYGRRPG